MQGKMHLGLSLLIIGGLAGSAVMPDEVKAQPVVAREATVTGHPVGLVMDARATAYTVDRNTGKVFCLPAGSDPVHYATVEGEPTALAVDRQRTVYVGTAQGAVLAVKRDGTVRHAWRCEECVTGLTVDRDGGLLIVTKGGAVIKKRRADLSVDVD